MDRFALLTGAVGLFLLFIAVSLFIYALIQTVRRKMKIKILLASVVVSIILFAFSLSSIYLSLFLQTFSRYTHEEKIGKIYAERIDKRMKIYFYNEKNKKEYHFNLSGDQWMIEGCLLRWSLWLRWLGAGSYYRITRFRGRWEIPKENITTEYVIQPEGRVWRFLLKYGKYIPLVDAAYGIGVFQYPSKDTFYLYINETGFILRIH